MSPQLMNDIKVFCKEKLDCGAEEIESDEELLKCFITTCDSLSPIFDMIIRLRELQKAYPMPVEGINPDSWMLTLLDLHERLMEEMLLGTNE